MTTRQLLRPPPNAVGHQVYAKQMLWLALPSCTLADALKWCTTTCSIAVHLLWLTTSACCVSADHASLLTQEEYFKLIEQDMPAQMESDGKFKG